jgi:hypothetical protein
MTRTLLRLAIATTLGQQGLRKGRDAAEKAANGQFTSRFHQAWLTKAFTRG